MIVKFIVVNYKGQQEIVFGEKSYTDDRHASIADAYAHARGIPRAHLAVKGGGLADTERKLIFGRSGDFGRYDSLIVRELVGDDWQIDISSFA